MKYQDFLRRLTEQFEHHVKEIVAEYNFDYGPEFEVAFCKVLRKVLAQKYGVCRGYVVSADSSTGDDIIIYDRERFPSLRFFEQDQFENKEYIPVEAVHAYIEAKYTLNIEGDKGDGQSYLKACTQVADVKKMPRESRPYGNPMPGWPRISNPMYGAVFARRVRRKKDGPILEDYREVNKAIVQAYNTRNLASVSPSPDLIVVGDGVIMMPLFRESKNDIWQNRSPFFIEGSSELIPFQVPGHAFAAGLLMLLYALDNIHLGRMPWHELINEAFKEAQEATLREFFGDDS